MFGMHRRSFERLEVLSAGRVSRFVAVTDDSNPIHAGVGALNTSADMGCT